MGKWGRCMIFGVEVVALRAIGLHPGLSIFLAFAGRLGLVPTVPTANTYILTDFVKK